MHATVEAGGRRGGVIECDKHGQPKMLQLQFRMKEETCVRVDLNDAFRAPASLSIKEIDWEIVKMNSTWTAAVAAGTGCSGPRAMRGHCGKAPQLNSKQISANYLTLIMNLEPAMRVSRASHRESRRERERKQKRDLQDRCSFMWWKGFSPSAVYLVLESWKDKKMLVLSNRLGSFAFSFP